jgi:nicotinate dehydrogenase subunit B
MTSALSRRAVLHGTGALIVGFALAPRALAQGAAPAKPALPGALKGAPMLNSWLKIGADGRVIVFTGKSELGQGIKTALMQIAAEQLDVPPSAVTLITSDTDLTPNEGYTAGSQSMSESGTAILHAAAQAREILIAVATSRLSTTADQLRLEDGAVVAPDGRRVRIGDLVSDELLHVEAKPSSTLKAPQSFQVMGRSLPRLDIPGKVTGKPAYVHDLRLPGMVHARVVRPPSYAAELRSIDPAPVERMPGVLKVMHDGNFLAVIADREFRAIKAMESLAANARWDERETMPDPASFYSWLTQQPERAIEIKYQINPASPADKTLEAEYRRPHQMHASIGPACAVASFDGDRLTVWTHAQGMFPLRQAIAQLTKLPENRIRCIHMEGAGCYGHNGADDAAADAAHLAVARPGAPVRVQWMRDQEHRWEPYGAGMLMRVKASLDAEDTIVDWTYEVWTDAHSTRPGGAGATLVGRHIANAFTPSPPEPGTQPAGQGDRNIVPLYAIANQRLTYHFVPHQKIRVSALRGLGAYANVFAIESFMDELALAAGADPVAFRLKHLTEPRAVDVIKLAAEKFGWNADSVLPPGHGRGFAFSRYKNLAAYCAIAVELRVEHETGAVRLIRAVAAVDSGTVVNPDGIRNQIEGGIVQSASWTLNESVAFDRTRIRSRDWASYPILRFARIFERVDVHVIDRPGQPFLGTGEAAQGPAAAAVANAVAHATSKRLRELPFTDARVKASIGV